MNYQKNSMIQHPKSSSNSKDIENFTEQYQNVIGNNKFKLFKFICANNNVLKMVKD